MCCRRIVCVAAVLQRGCPVLQHVLCVLQTDVVCCRRMWLQCVAVCCSVLQIDVVRCMRVLLQCVAGDCCGSVLPCVAVCCSVLQGVAGCCRVLQCVAVCFSVLHGEAKARMDLDAIHTVRS